MGTLEEIDDLEDAVKQFAAGVYLADNDVTCRPAGLQRVEAKDECTYRITLFEGRRHQVKCMINAVSRGTNRVVALHRESIGHVELDSSLSPGEWRHLTEMEVAGFR